MWKTAGDSASSAYDAKSRRFNATVVEVHSGDCVSVMPEGAEITKKLFFASVRSPAMAQGRSGGENEPWAFEAKELVRKHTIGQKVLVEMEFKKEIELKRGPNTGEKRKMEFASITCKGTHVGVMVVEKGYARANLTKNADENSKYFEELINAEQIATKKKLGIHSKKAAKQYSFVDTTQNSKASKTLEKTLFSAG